MVASGRSRGRNYSASANGACSWYTYDSGDTKTIRWRYRIYSRPTYHQELPLRYLQELTQEPSSTKMLEKLLPRRYALPTYGRVETNSCSRGLYHRDEVEHTFFCKRPTRTQLCWIYDANWVKESGPRSRLDEMWILSSEFVKTRETVSISMLQRQFRVGYNRRLSGRWWNNAELIVGHKKGLTSHG